MSINPELVLAMASEVIDTAAGEIKSLSVFGIVTINRIIAHHNLQINTDILSPAQGVLVAITAVSCFMTMLYAGPETILKLILPIRKTSLRLCNEVLMWRADFFAAVVILVSLLAVATTTADGHSDGSTLGGSTSATSPIDNLALVYGGVVGVQTIVSFVIGLLIGQSIISRFINIPFLTLRMALILAMLAAAFTTQGVNTSYSDVARNMGVRSD